LRGLRILGPLLAHQYRREGLALDAEPAIGNLAIEIIEAAMHGLSGDALLVLVGAGAEEGLLPVVARDLVVVLDIGILDDNDGEAVDILFPDIEDAGVPAQAEAPLALPLAEAGLFNDECNVLLRRL